MWISDECGKGGASTAYSVNQEQAAHAETLLVYTVY